LPLVSEGIFRSQIFENQRKGHILNLTDGLRDVRRKNGDKDPYLIGVDARNLGRDFRSDRFNATLAFEPQRNLHGVTSGCLKVYDGLWGTGVCRAALRIRGAVL
jgi:hypothetical protein